MVVATVTLPRLEDVRYYSVIQHEWVELHEISMAQKKLQVK